MKKTLCDGCFHRGVEKELIEPHYAKVRLTDQTATVLDLCLDICMPFYEEYAKAQEMLATGSARAYQQAAKQQEIDFWKKVKRGGQTLRSKKSDRIGQSETQGISPR